MARISKKPKQEKLELIAASQFEPNRANRFLVKFPAEFIFSVFSANSVALPSFTNCGCWFRNPWSDLEIKMISVIGQDALPILHRSMSMKNFEIVVEQLDPTGFPTSTWRIKCAKIDSLDYGYLSNSSEDIFSFVVRFKVKDVIHEFVEVSAAK